MPFGHKAGLPPSKKYLLMRQPQLFVPQASQSSYDRRTELEVLFAIPSAQSACGMEIRMKTGKEKTKWIWKRYRNVFL